MIDHKTTVCPYCKRSYLYATHDPKVKCCGELLPAGFVKNTRQVVANRSIDYRYTERLSKEQWVELYRAHWESLHRIPQQLPTWTAREGKRLYKRWRETIPVTGCDCGRKWNEIERENPPDTSSQEAFFEWSVKVHNEVNKKLGKPFFSLDEAKAKYTTPTE